MTAPLDAENVQGEDHGDITFTDAAEPLSSTKHSSTNLSNLHLSQLGTLPGQSDASKSSKLSFATNTAYVNYPEYGSKPPDSNHSGNASSHLIEQAQQNLAGVAQFGTPLRNVVNLASFGAQPWFAAPTPYLDFAPRAEYELTGELIQDDRSGFPNFNDAFIYAPSALSPEQIPQKSPITAQQPKFSSSDLPQNLGPQQQALLRSALKRKADGTEPAIQFGLPRKQPQSTRPGKVNPRTVSFESMSAPPSSEDGPSSDSSKPARSSPNLRRSSQIVREAIGITSNAAQTRGRPVGSGREVVGGTTTNLPQEKVFPIQIGSELFRLSGASISSDAPSYFTHFFEDQIRQNEESGGVRTLYIDRDAAIFRDIARHLQGYHIQPMDGSHFVRLFADAQFYHLPRLIEQLFKAEIFIQIGERHFQLPKDIFSDPGNTPNFFSLGFAIFFSTPGDVFPGLDQRGLLRPPSITPPYVAGRSADIFAELIQILRGYPVHIRDEIHRASLLRDCRYFHLRGLEQKLIAHNISYNLERDKHEIVLRFEDVKPSGISFKADNENTGYTPSGWIYYSRPFVDDTNYELVVEIGGETMMLDLNQMRAEFRGLSKSRINSLFQVVANKMNLPSNAPLGLVMLSGASSSQNAIASYNPLSEDLVKVRFDESSSVTLDGEDFDIDPDTVLGKRFFHGPSGLVVSSAAGAKDTQGRPTTASPPLKSPLSKSDAELNPSRRQASRQQQQQQQQQQKQLISSQTATQSSSLSEASDTGAAGPAGSVIKKRKRQTSEDEIGRWIIRTGQWRLKIQPKALEQVPDTPELVLVVVKIDAYTSGKVRNSKRGYLGT